MLSAQGFAPSPMFDQEAIHDHLVPGLMSAIQEHRLGQLFQALPVACFCYDSSGQVTEWNRACESLFHHTASNALACQAWRLIGRAEDREIIQALLTSVLSGHSYEGFQWEDVSPDGGRRHLLSSAFPLFDGDRQIIGGISTNVDISERVQMEQALWENEERWQIALRGNNDGIWDWDSKSRRLFVSPRWKQILGYAEADRPTSQTVDDLRRAWPKRIHPADRAAALAALESHLDQQTPCYSSEHRIRCKDGSYKWILDRGQGLWNRNGEMVRIAGSFTDITQRKAYEQQIRETCRDLEAANARLEALATEDGLTGLKNHRAFQERLASEMARCQRHEILLSLILLDVDRFKQYNDTYGHPAGDQVLKRVASLLQQSVRPADMVARYGGEEFVIVLPHTDAAGAVTVAERCRLAIESSEWPCRAVTASFGVASAQASTNTSAALVSAADQALYVAKNGGRNCVRSVCGS